MGSRTITGPETVTGAMESLADIYNLKGRAVVLAIEASVKIHFMSLPASSKKTALQMAEKQLLVLGEEGERLLAADFMPNNGQGMLKGTVYTVSEAWIRAIETGALITRFRIHSILPGPALLASFLEPSDYGMNKGTVIFVHLADQSIVFYQMENGHCRHLEHSSLKPGMFAYLGEEKPYMLPLPASAFEPAVWSVAKVASDYLVTDGRNKYSVPCNLIGERVDIRVTRTTVEVFYHGSRVASHRRLQTRQRDPLVKREHMPPEHQKYLTYNAEEFSRWAMSVGPMTEKVAEHFLKSGKAAEQGYKACAGLTKLEQRYGKLRLEAACSKVLVYSTEPSLRTIASILKNGLDKPDKAESQTAQPRSNSYGITRGAAYFRKGGDR